MADDIAKSLDSLTKALAGNTQASTKSKKSLDANKDSAKNLASAMKQVAGEIDDVNEGMGILNKTMSKSDYKIWLKHSAGARNYSKEVDEAEKSLQNYYDAVDKTRKASKFLNSETNEQIDNIKKLDKELSDMTKTLSDDQRKITALSNAISGMTEGASKYKRSLAGIVKSGAVSFFEKTKGKLSELQGVIDKSDFDAISKQIKNLDDTPLDKLPKAIEEIEKKFEAIDLANLYNKGEITTVGKDLVAGIGGAFSQLTTDVKVDAKGILNAIDLLKDAKGFESLDSQSKEFLENLRSNMEKGLLPASEVDAATQKASDILSKFAENAKKSLDPAWSGIKEIADLIAGEHNKISASLSKPLTLKVQLAVETASMQDQIGQITNKQQETGFISESEAEVLKTLLQQEAVLQSQTDKADELAKYSLDKSHTEAQILAETKKEEKANKKILEQSKKINELASNRLKIIAKVQAQGLGEEKVKAYSAKWVEAGERINQFKDSLTDTKMGFAAPALGAVGKAVNNIGDGIMSAKGSIGVLTAVVGAIQAIVNFDTKIKKLYADVADTGAMVGVSAENMGSELEKAFQQSQNVDELTRALAGVSGAVVLNTADLLGMQKAYISTGISAQELARQTKDTASYTKDGSNALLTAGKIAHIYAQSMGKTDTEMAAFIGDLSFQYGTTLNGIDKGFSEVAEAASTATMGANRFMATVQSATAGMAIYDDQIIAVAKSLKGMEGKGLTGAQQAATLKGTGAAMADPEKMMAGITALGPELSKKMFKTMADVEQKKATMVSEDIERMKAADAQQGIKEGSPEANKDIAIKENELAITKDNAAQLLKAAEGGVEAQRAIFNITQKGLELSRESQDFFQGTVIAIIRKRYEKDYALQVKMGQQAGRDVADIQTARQTGGTSVDLLMKPAEDLASGATNFRTITEQGLAADKAQKAKAELDQKTKNPIPDILKQTYNLLQSKSGPLFGIIEAVSVGVATIAALLASISFFTAAIATPLLALTGGAGAVAALAASATAVAVGAGIYSALKDSEPEAAKKATPLTGEDIKNWKPDKATTQKTAPPSSTSTLTDDDIRKWGRAGPSSPALAPTTLAPTLLPPQTAKALVTPAASGAVAPAAGAAATPATQGQIGAGNAPINIVQNMYGITDRNFHANVKTALVDIVKKDVNQA